MADIPKPKSADERVFVSAYRFDSARGWLVKYLIPAMGVFCLVAFPWWCLRFYQLLDADMPEDARIRLQWVLGAVLLLGVTTAFLFFGVARSLRRRFYETIVFYDKEGIRYRSGAKEVACPWNEIKDLRVQDRGRLQTATVIGPGGRFTLDASLFNAHGPHPTIKMSFSGEKLVYPNGYIIPMKIRENELFGVVEKRFAAQRKGDKPSS